MPFAKCKVYSDGSHYIAIPHKPQRPRPRKGAKVKKEVPDLEELEEDEAEDCPFDKPAPPAQMSLFDGEKKDDVQGESAADSSKNGQTCEEKEDNTASKPSRKEIFEQLYRKHINDNYKKRKRAIIQRKSTEQKKMLRAK